MHKDMRVFVLSLSAAVFFLGGCSSGKEDQQAAPSAEWLYNRAADALDERHYTEATKNFEEVERQFPYSRWATQAQLMAAYASYVEQRYDEAVFALDRFMELHPGSKDIDYALYLKALSFYEQISDVRRDQDMTREALGALEILIRRFPESDYARDATLKRDLTMDHLAGKEMEIGRYYMKRGDLNAAINRFLTVVKDYQTTSHTAEALHRLVEAYLTLGLREEATRIAAVLGYNYPGNKWYQRSYALLDKKQRQKLLDERSWLDRTMDSLLTPADEEDKSKE